MDKIIIRNYLNFRHGGDDPWNLSCEIFCSKCIAILSITNFYVKENPIKRKRKEENRY